MTSTIKALIAVGRHDQAERRLQDWLARHPGDAEAHDLLGQSRWRAGDWAQAETAWRRALACNGLDPTVHHRLGVLLYRRGRTLPPLGHFFAAVTLQPDALGTQRYICNILAREAGRTGA